jgi:putative flippase GtrA
VFCSIPVPVSGSNGVSRLGQKIRGALMDAAPIRYVLASLLSAGITLGVPVVMVELGGLDPSLAAATALLLALVANFLLRNDGRWQAQAVRYLLVAALFRLGEFCVFLVLHHLLGLFYVVAGRDARRIVHRQIFRVLLLGVFRQRCGGPAHGKELDEITRDAELMTDTRSFGSRATDPTAPEK